MKKNIVVLAVTLALFSALACKPPLNFNASDTNGKSTKPFIKSSASDAELKATNGVRYGYIIAKTDTNALRFDSELMARYGLEELSRTTMNGGSYVYLKVADGASYTAAMGALRKISGIAWVEPEVLYAQPEVTTGQQGGGISIEKQRGSSIDGLLDGNLNDDPYGKAAEYALTITKALDSYQTNGYGSNKVVIAIIDTGINWTHEDFRTDPENPDTSVVLYAKSAFTKAADGAMTWVGDKVDLVPVPKGENWDDEAHGSHCSGTMLACGDNGKGIAGVAWKNTQLISYKCFATAASGSGAGWSVYGSLKDLTDCVIILRKDPASRTPAEKAKLPASVPADYKIDQATVPVNMSLGGDFASAFAIEVVNYALAHGVLPIVAMGNDGQTVGQFPAAYQGVVAVGATNGRDEKVHFSNSGPHISVSAPGYDIISTGNGDALWTDPNSSKDDYQWMSGTSMATPFVTGLVGYMMSFNKDLTPSQVKTLLEENADDKGAAGFDEDYGHGRVNVKNTAAKIKAGTLPAPGATYLDTMITVNVNNVNASYDSGIPGNGKRLPNQEVWLYNAAGTQLVTLGITSPSAGSVQFKGLKAGTYMAKVNFFGELKTAPVTVNNASDTVLDIDFNKTIVFICTVPNKQYNGGNDTTDTMIAVYKENTADPANPTLIAEYDQELLDTLTLELAAGTYYAKITPYDTNTGNYAIQIGFNRITEATIADGARTAADDDSHEDDDDFAKADAKGPLALGTPFGANILDAADIFKFVIP